MLKLLISRGGVETRDKFHTFAQNESIMTAMLSILLLLTISFGTNAVGEERTVDNDATNQLNYTTMADQKFYCEYCGNDFSSVQSLTRNKCAYHPDGAYKGYHKLYEGSEKSKYTCKYCGNQYNTIRTLTSCKCPKHPQGAGKGWHAPAL